MTSDDDPTDEDRVGFDVHRPQSARVWNYWLGGKDNFAADRQVGDAVMAVFSGVVDLAWQSRAFLGRAVGYLAGEVGIDQFLDIGTGLPTVDNTHQIAQRVNPAARVVYVDNDPLVLAHARALLTSNPHGTTDYVDADARNTGLIVQQAARTLDLDRPVAIIMVGLLGNISDDEVADWVAAGLRQAAAPGSYLAIADGTSSNPQIVQGARVSAEAGHPYTLRSPEQIADFFGDWEIADPGVVPIPAWRPDPDDPPPPPRDDGFCGLARKPSRPRPD